MKREISPRELAESIGVSESSLKRWADEGTIHAVRTAGGHRRIPIQEAIRFIREIGIVPQRPELLGWPDLGAAPRDLDGPEAESQALYQYLLEGREREARGLIQSLYLAGRSVAEISDGPIRGAMARVGELWQSSSEGIFLEHRAMDICLQAVNQLRVVIAPPRSACVAVGAAPSGDPYLLPSALAAAVLMENGWVAINLGPDTPLPSLELAARNFNASLIWLSVSARINAAGLSREIVAMAKVVAGRRINVIVGGRSHHRLSLPRLANLHTGSSMAEVAAFARGLVAAAERERADQAIDDSPAS